MNIKFGQQATKVKQLADLISRDISMGIYKPENALPSINRLSNHYHVSRDTVFKAFADLKERNLIDSTPGKGYYITNKIKNVLLLLDEYSSFKYDLYNSFIKKLSVHYKVDLLFHQYNERLFNTIVRESLGKYNKYVIMNFDNERFSANLYKIEPSRLLLLDFGKFDKKNYSYICQDFDEGFYQALSQLKAYFTKYNKLTLLFPQGSKHPQSSREHFIRFCTDQQLEYTVQDCSQIELTPQKGEAYIAIRQIDIVNLIKQSRKEGLTCGTDFGLVAYNDTPAYEIIDKGITALSINWECMGQQAAEFVVSGKEVQIVLPTEVRLRHSL